MNKEAKETTTTKERIIVLEKGTAANESPLPMGIACCAAPLFPFRFW